MKIACISKESDPRCIGGIETFERVLMKIFKDDIRFYVFKTEKEKIFEAKNIVSIQELKQLSEKIMLKLLGKKKYLKFRVLNDKPDIIIMNRAKDLRLFKNFKGVKILVQHTSIDRYIKETSENKKLVELMKNNIDYFVTLSDKSKEAFQEYLGNKIKYITIRHSCELPLLVEEKIKNKKLIIISRLENGQKRLDLAIKVMKKLTDYTLNIYGEGTDEEILRKLIKEIGVESRVFLHKKTNKIKEKLDESGIFIMTSDHEGYPITSVEALTRGLPIVLRNTFESAEDIVRENGILLSREWDEDKFVEAVEKVYNNYEEYSKKSIELAKRYQFKIIEKKWKELIKNLK